MGEVGGEEEADSQGPPEASGRAAAAPQLLARTLPHSQVPVTTRMPRAWAWITERERLALESASPRAPFFGQHFNFANNLANIKTNSHFYGSNHGRDREVAAGLC